MRPPRLDVGEAARGDPEDLLGRVIELRRGDAQPAEQPPDRGVMRLEQRAQIESLDPAWSWDGPVPRVRSWPQRMMSERCRHDHQIPQNRNPIPRSA